MQCNAHGTWLPHRSVLQVRRNEWLLVLVVGGPHEGVMFSEMRLQAGALEKSQPIKDGLVSTVVLHPRCAVDALEGLACLGGCWGHVLIGRD